MERAINPLHPVDTRVIAVSDTMNLVILAAGRRAGLLVGCELTLYRGDKFLGKLIVEKTDADWSSCRSLLDLQVGRPRVGDQAATKLY